jgi:AcrR family transcriptional regulator
MRRGARLSRFRRLLGERSDKGGPKLAQRRQASGRPRDPDVERRAFKAARLIYGEAGKSQVTFANVAARAGIGKPALYRRWQTPHELLMDALRAIPLPDEAPDLGDAQAELAHYARDLMRLYVSPDGAAMLRVTTEFHDETEPFRQWIGRCSAVSQHLACRRGPSWKSSPAPCSATP